MEQEDLANSAVDLLARHFELREKLAGLRRQMVDLLNESELRDLAFDLGANYDALPGSGTADKCRELILYCQRRRLLYKLVFACAKRRPNAFKPEDFPPEEQPAAVSFESSAAIYNNLQEYFSRESFYAETLTRLADRPNSAGRRAAMSSLLLELMDDDPNFAESLKGLLGQNLPLGDRIKQQITLSDQAQAGDINMIGKIEGSVDVSAFKKK